MYFVVANFIIFFYPEHSLVWTGVGGFTDHTIGLANVQFVWKVENVMNTVILYSEAVEQYYSSCAFNRCQYYIAIVLFTF